MRYVWLTPPAPAAIALLRCPACAALFDRPLPAPGAARFARLRDPAGAAIDEVVVTRLDDTRLEVCVHGGIGVRAAVDACLAAHGLRADAPAADHWSRLAAAPSPAAVAWLLAHGADARPTFPEAFLARLPVVLISGPANAGKSTLLNAWCGHGRALVSDRPGTTRDLLSALAVIAGWRIRLVDSAGLREPGDALERAGQDLVGAARAGADLVIVLVPVDDPDARRLARPGDLVVAAKADLAPDPPSGVAWSAVGLPGRASASLLADLGAAVLARLGLG